MEPDTFVRHLRADGAALLQAARVAPEATVVTCPDWTLADLVGHVGTGHRWVESIVRTRATTFVAFPERPTGWEDLVRWYGTGLDSLASTLDAVGPDDTVWNWTPAGGGPARFWHRRMAHETAVHRWDAEHTVGDARAIDPALALDGVDEALGMLAMRLGMKPEPELHGALGLAATDGDLACTLLLSPEGVERRPGLDGADAVVRAGASDLQLWLAGRRSVGDEGIEVDGDESVAEALGEMKFG